jgi:hypothetical protein
MCPNFFCPQPGCFWAWLTGDLISKDTRGGLLNWGRSDLRSSPGRVAQKTLSMLSGKRFESFTNFVRVSILDLNCLLRMIPPSSRRDSVINVIRSPTPMNKGLSLLFGKPNRWIRMRQKGGYSARNQRNRRSAARPSRREPTAADRERLTTKEVFYRDSNLERALTLTAICIDWRPS